MPKKNSLFFFFIIFILVNICSLLNIILFKAPNLNQKGFFLLNALSQNILLVLLLYTFANFLEKKAKKLLFPFAFLTFVLLMLFITDVVLLKLFDLTVWDGFKLAFDENWDNFLEMLHTTNIPFYGWILICLSALIFPLLGSLFYHFLTKKNYRFPITNDHLSFVFIIAIVCFCQSPPIHIENTEFCELKRHLFLKTAFRGGQLPQLQAKFQLKPLRSPSQTVIDTIAVNLEKKPNIFLFIIESLRKDYISEELTPNLQMFKQNCLSVESTSANANFTHAAWFSIFHSEFPLYWKSAQTASIKKGSLPLKLLKKMGYKIHLYTTPELKYYKMDEILFGNNMYLIDHYHPFFHYSPISPHDSDALALQALQENISSKDGNCYIIFLDTLHFIYEWPNEKPAIFFPNFRTDCFSILRYPEIIKNTYKNALYYFDSLFENFFASLKKNDAYDSSIFILTADHGQEFFEEGNLFHASVLTRMQTSIPIWYKFPNNFLAVKKNLTSQMDIFPTLFHYLFQENVSKNFLKGESIFAPSSWPYVITTRYNASRFSWEFLIYDGQKKLILQFSDHNNIFAKQKLKIKALKNNEDQNIELKKNQPLIENFQKSLDRIFQVSN